MMAEKDPVTPEQVAALAARITGIETLLAQKIPGFEQVGARVSELSTAFQQANQRLAGLETAILNLPTGSDAEEINTLRLAVNAISERMTAVETTRLRGGRLSARLAEIEARLPDAAEGGTPE